MGGGSSIPAPPPPMTFDEVLGKVVDNTITPLIEAIVGPIPDAEPPHLTTEESKCYLGRYTDLQKEYGKVDNNEALQNASKHYFKYGQNEGRNPKGEYEKDVNDLRDTVNTKDLQDNLNEANAIIANYDKDMKTAKEIDEKIIREREEAAAAKLE